MLRCVIMRAGLLVAMAGLMGAAIGRARDADGWVDLLARDSLAGWRESEETPGCWTIRDGVLTGRGGRSHLFYEGDALGDGFRDFEYELEAMTEPNANSGVYFHTAYQASGWPSRGMEVQVNNSYDKDRRRTASLYGIQDVHDVLVRDNEWWTLSIRVQGDRVITRVNGRPRVDYTQPAEPKKPLGSGTFAFQAHDPGCVVHYRNVRVRRLGPEDPPPDAITFADLRFDGSRAPLTALETSLGNLAPEERLQVAARMGSILADESLNRAARQGACRILTRIGGTESVPVLARCLADPELGHLARHALARIPGPEADEALLAGLGQTQGRLRLGIVRSLGRRRCAVAEPALRPLLGDADMPTARAAARALGDIGSATATAALQAALTTTQADARALAVADGLLRAAERRLDEEDPDTALGIYAALSSPNWPEHILAAALEGRVRVLGGAAVPLLIRTLTTAQPKLQALAARYVVELEGAGVTSAFAEQLSKVDGAARIALVQGLGRRGDPVAATHVLRVLNSTDRTARDAALDAMRFLGTAEHLPSVLATISSLRGSEREAACETVARSVRPDADDGLRRALLRADPRVQALATRVAGRRPASPETLPIITEALGAEPEALRLAAIDVLPEMAPVEALPTLMPALVGRLAPAGGDAEREAVRRGLARLCRRLPEPAAGALALSAAIAAAGPGPVRCDLLRAYGRLGVGATGLLETHAGAAHPETAEAAVRALCDWPVPETGVPALVGVAERSASPVHRILALRAATDLVARAVAESAAPEAWLEPLEQILALTGRPEEKRLVLGVLAAVPHADGLALSASCLNDAATRVEAATAMVNAARGLLVVDAESARKAITRAMAACDAERVQADGESALALADRLADYVLAWQVSGPCTLPDGQPDTLLPHVFPPETAPDTVEWRAMPVEPNPEMPWLLDLSSALGGDRRAAYLRTFVHADHPLAARLELGTDDAVKAWVNGVRVHTHLVARGVNPGDDVLRVRLYPGWNEIMLKVVQGGGDWGACARIVATDGSRMPALRVARTLTPEQRPELVARPLPPELVLHWPLDTVDDGRVYDLSGHASHGETLGEPDVMPGVNGQALRFDGNGDRARVTQAPQLPVEPGDAWSMNLYLRPDEAPGRLTMFGGFGDASSRKPIGCQRFVIQLHDKVHFWGANVDVTGTEAYVPGRWQMVTVTYDGTTLRLYRDGREIAVSDEALAPAAAQAHLVPPNHWLAEDPPEFAGLIDDFRIWRGVLAPNRIAALAERLPAAEENE